MEDFKVATTETIVRSRSTTFLTSIVTRLTGFRQLVGILIVAALILALFTSSILLTLGTDTLVEAIASAFLATRMTESADCLLRSRILLVEAIGTRCVFDETFLDCSIHDFVIALDAALVGECIAWTCAAIASFVALETDSVFDIFVRWTRLNTVFAVFDVFALIAVV